MMRSLLVVVAWCLCLGFLDASDSVFVPGYSHIYNYSIVLSTTTSSGDPQYAAVAFQTRVRIDAVSSQKAIIQFEEVQVAKENKELRKLEVESSQWSFKQVSEYSDKLRIPFEVDFKNGQVERISFAREDPLWSSEMKKGLAQLIQAQVKAPSSNRNDGRRSRDNQKAPAVYTIKEASLSGICDTEYILNELQSPSSPEATVLNITKIRDYNECDEKVVFAQSNYHAYKCSDCEADKSHPISKTAIISLNLKVTHDGHYLLEDGSSTGLIKVSPLGEEADQYQALCNKTIELVSVRPLSQAREVRTDRKETLVSSMNDKVEEAMKEQNRKEPVPVPFLPKMASVQEIRAQINSVAEVLDNADSTKKAWRTALSHIILAVRNLRQCNYEELEELRQSYRSQSSNSRHESKVNSQDDSWFNSQDESRFNSREESRFNRQDESRFNSREESRFNRQDESRFNNREESSHSSHDDAQYSSDTKRGLYLDLLAQAGTYPALLVWKKATENQDFSRLRSLNFIQVFASHCQYPRPQILELIKEVAKHDSVHQDEQLLTTILMSYAHLVSKTCVRNKHYWNNAVEPEILCPQPQKFIQPLVDLLEKTSKPAIQIAAVNALGETKLKEAIAPLKQYALGEATDCDVLQAQAVFAINKCARLHPSAVKSVLQSVYYNVEEDTKVRIAALTGLFATQLTRHQMEKLAIFTWKETDTTVGTFLVKSLEQMANSSHPCVADQTSHAEHALNLINEEFDDGNPFVLSKFYEKQIPEIDVSAFMSTSYVADGHPIAPQMAYANFRPQIAGFNPEIFRLSMLASGSKSAIDQLFGPASAFQDHSFFEVLRQIDDPNRNLGLKDLAGKLGLKTREDDETKGVLKMTLLGGQHRVVYYDKQKLVKWAAKAASMLQKLGQGIDFNYRRTVMPVDINIITPTPAGLPLVFRVKSPMHYGVRGRISVKCEGCSRGLNNIKELAIDLKLKPTFAMKVIPTFGVRLPAERVLVGASYSTMVIAKPYIGGKLIVKRDNGLTLVIKPEISQHKNIFHYSTLPMTFLYKYDTNKPIFESALPITFLDKPQTNKIHLDSFKYAPMVLKLEQDTFWHSRATVIDWLSRHSCPASLPFIWVTQSWKNRDYSLEYQEGSAHQNPEFEIQLTGKYEASEAKPHKKVHHGLRGILTYLMGWANPKDTCGRETMSYSKPWEMSHQTHQHHAGNRDSRQQRNRDSSEEIDSDSVWALKRSKSSSHRYEESNEDYDQRQESQESQDYDIRNWDNNRRDRSAVLTQHKMMMHSRSGANSEHSYRDEDHSSNRGQANIRLANTRQGVSRLEWQLRAFARGEENKAVTAKLVLEKHQADIKKVFSLTLNVPGNQIQKVCLRGNMHFPRRPCYQGGELPSYRNKEFRSDIQLQWGQDCASPSGSVEMQISAKKTHEQNKYDSLPSSADIKPWFYAQCKKDRLKGIPYSDACDDSLNHLARLNHFTLVAKYEKIPPVLANITKHIVFAVAAKYFKYIEYNPVEVNNPSKTVKLEVHYHYDMPALDANISTPFCNAHIRKFPYRKVSQLMGPFNVRRTIRRKIADVITEDSPYATAFVSGNTVNTFDNQTYTYKQWGQCKHVLVMDCSSSHMFAVLTKPAAASNKQKELIVRILDHKIELDATESNKENLTINGVPQRIREHERVFVHDKKSDLVVAYITKSVDKYTIRLPQVGLRVVYDGYTTYVAMSQMWQDKVCGVFGDYDNDFIYEYRGPKQCAFENGAEMAKAYAVADGTCSPPSVSSKKVCDQEDNRDHDSVHSSSSQRNSCYYEKTLRSDVGDQICVSKRPVQRCSPGCHAKSESKQAINFTCMDKDDPKAARLVRQLDANRPAYDVRDSPVHFRKPVSIPDECSHQ